MKLVLKRLYCFELTEFISAGTVPKGKFAPNQQNLTCVTLHKFVVVRDKFPSLTIYPGIYQSRSIPSVIIQPLTRATKGILTSSNFCTETEVRTLSIWFIKNAGVFRWVVL